MRDVVSACVFGCDDRFTHTGVNDEATNGTDARTNGRLFTSHYKRSAVSCAPMRISFIDRRAAFAIAASFLIHALIVVLPYFGTMVKRAEQDTPASAPVSFLSARLMEGSPAHPESELQSSSQSPVSGVASASGENVNESKDIPDQTRSRSAEAGPGRETSIGTGALPLPAPTFHTVDQLTKRPTPLVEPRFPQVRAMGKVVANVWIDELGNVVSAEVAESNLPATISAGAAEAFGNVRYSPGEIEGRPVATVIKVEIVFERDRLTSGARASATRLRRPDAPVKNDGTGNH